MKKILLILLLLAGACAQHERKTVYLDDVGSRPIFLQNITEVLERHKVDVVYFTVADRLDAGTAGMLKNKITGVHGLTHYCGEFYKNYTESKKLLSEALEKFNEKNLTPKYFRPPCDMGSDGAKQAAKEAGLVYVKRTPDFLFDCRQDCIKEASALREYLKTNKATTIHQNEMDAYKLKVFDEVLAQYD